MQLRPWSAENLAARCVPPIEIPTIPCRSGTGEIGSERHYSDFFLWSVSYLSPVELKLGIHHPSRLL